MGLFSPWFLAGLFALGLPLWLHLLRQFKRTPQPFSSLMFFERQIQSSSKHRRLRYITLLILRMLLLALLALLFANPFINRAASEVAPHKLRVVAVDRSFSMRYQNRLAEAKKQASEFVNGFQGGDRMQLFALDSHLIAIIQPTTDKTSVAEAVESIEAGDDASSYGEFTRALKVMEQTTGLSLDVHLFTDAQQTSMPAAFSDLQLGQRTSLTIHAIGSGESPNWAVQSVSVPARTYDAGNVRLTAGVSGWQTKEARRKITVVLDGRPVASKDVLVPASGRTAVEFNDLAISFGAHRGQVQIEPHDDLPNDDAFPFSIERADPRRVLFLANAGRSAEGFFFKSALDASVSTGLRVQVDSISESSRLDLSPYALVVINNPGDLDSSSAQALSDYVAKGGSALIAVGPATVRAGVIPISGLHVSGSAARQSGQTNSADLFGTDVFDRVQFFATPLIKIQPSDRVRATFADGSPLLVEQKKGEGKLMIFAATLDNTSSDFPVHSGFLPFVAATGAYMAGATDNLSSVVVGSAVPLRQSKNQSASADVIGPDGKHEFPLSDATRIMSFNPMREGFYDVHSANGRRMLLAVHADRRESNLERVSAETLILWRNTSKGGEVAPGTVTGSTTIQFSLWRYVLFFVLIAAIVESVFATRYLTEERQAS